MVKLSTIKPNPSNPRLIKDDNFKKLCNNIRSLPKMMALRPIVIDEERIIQGGNMRYRALLELGYTEVEDEWVKSASDFTEDELRQFAVLDNVGFGEWDWEMVSKDYDPDELSQWGLDVPDQPSDTTKIKEINLTPYVRTHVLLSFPPEKMIEIQALLQQITAFPFIEYEQSNN